jgi:hypothetical protein
MHATVHRPGEGEPLGGATTVTMKATGEQTGGSFYLGETVINPERAARLGGAAEHISPVGVPLIQDRIERQFFRPSRETLGASAWRKAHESGARMQFAEAIEHALDDRSTHPASTSARDERATRSLQGRRVA